MLLPAALLNRHSFLRLLAHTACSVQSNDKWSPAVWEADSRNEVALTTFQVQEHLTQNVLQGPVWEWAESPTPTAPYTHTPLWQEMKGTAKQSKSRNISNRHHSCLAPDIKAPAVGKRLWEYQPWEAHPHRKANGDLLLTASTFPAWFCWRLWVPNLKMWFVCCYLHLDLEASPKGILFFPHIYTCQTLLSILASTGCLNRAFPVVSLRCF